MQSINDESTGSLHFTSGQVKSGEMRPDESSRSCCITLLIYLLLHEHELLIIGFS